MGVTVDAASVRAAAKQMYQRERPGVATRVKLDGVPRFECADIVREAMNNDPTVQEWWIAPTAGGTRLVLYDAKTAIAVLTTLADHLTATGYHGTIIGNPNPWGELVQLSRSRPIPASAILAFTIDPPYQDGPVNQAGVLDHRWGVPHDLTTELAREWVDWAMTEDTRAVIAPAQIDVTVEDAVDVLVPNIEAGFPSCQLLANPTGSEIVRVVRTRHYGEVMLAESGTNQARIPQALTLLTDHVLPHAAQLDYATIRVTYSLAQFWTTSDGSNAMLWKRRIRHLWSQYVADPNAIQVLTDAHLDKAHDLTNWHVTPICPGRWLVQAKDLDPWFNHIDEESAGRRWQYLDPDLLAAARHDFGDMILTQDIADANDTRRRPLR